MSVLDNAHLMVASHLRVVPIGPGTKYPPIPEWQLRATDDASTITEWFSSNPTWGLGWKMGAQGDGRFLFAIDVDVPKGGKEAMRGLVTAYNLADELTNTTTARTGGGGFHFVFELPADSSVVPVNRSKLRPGVDIRAEGGQIVVSPTIHPETHQAYAWAPLKAPWELPPALAGPGLLAMLEALLAPPAAPLRLVQPDRWHPSMGDEITPVNYARDHFDWTTYLLKHGWTQVGGDAWRRPGKADRGHSALLHGNGAGPFNVFTTDIPPALERLGKLDPTGQCLSITLFDFIAAYEHGGDRAACASWVRRNYLGGAVGGKRAQATDDSAAVTGGATETVGTTVTTLPVVTGEYWSASVRNAHIAAAARARMISPDALDVVMFSLQACLVPPAYMLEAIVGPPQPLNVLSCLIGRTGDFKTATMGTAWELAGPFPPWCTSVGLGSGEGIGAMFLREGTETDAKGRKVKTNQLVRNDLRAVFFEVDEGMTVSKAMMRQGATVIATLCKAWSGSMLGEANADTARRRHVLHNDYRIGALVNIQPSNFTELFSEANTGTGLTGRFLFSGTLDHDIPEAETVWPGQLEFPTMPQMPVLITLDDAIRRAAKDQVRQRHRAGTLDGALDEVAQTPATTARLAAIVALAEDRRHVTEADWELAKVRTDCSNQALFALSTHALRSANDRRHATDRARAVSREHEESEYERIKTGQTVDRIVKVLSAGPMSGGNITAKLAPSMRPYRDDALEHLVAMGKVRLEGEQWVGL